MKYAIHLIVGLSTTWTRKHFVIAQQMPMDGFLVNLFLFLMKEENAMNAKKPI